MNANLPPDAMHLLGPGSIVAGRWQILRTIGRGGMGTVFEARHQMSRRVVALKVLDLALARDARHLVRFQREVSIRAEVGHDGIVDVLDAGIDPDTGRPFVAMELLVGETLRERMARPEVPREALLAAVRQALDPLAAAHAHGVVHRDLKPENMFLARAPDGSERVKLLDFGIAVSREGQRATRAGVPMGTPGYMSPEQTIDAASVNDRADSWSIGVMLFEITSGRTPFVGQTPGEVFTQVMTTSAPSLASVAHHTPPRFQALVDRCLQRDPSARPSIGAIAAELDVLLAPPRAAPPPAPEPRRSRSILPLVVALLAALVCVGGVGALAAFRWLGGDGTLVPTGSPTGPANPPLTPARAVALLPRSRVPPPLDAPVPATPTGPLVVQIVTDLECPPCSSVTPTVANALERRYPDGVRFAMRFYPLPAHHRAHVAWEAGLEARAQGGDAAFFHFFDAMLLAEQGARASGVEPDLSDAALVSAAASAPGVDAGRVAAALADHRHAARVDRDIAQLDAFAGGGPGGYGRKYGVPTFIVHDVVCWGTNQLELVRAVEQALSGREPDPCSFQ